MESIIVALITGGLALVGVIFTNLSSNKQIENKLTTSLATSQAVTDAKIESLTEEVKKHNEFWMKVPVLENRLDNLERDVKEMQHAGTR